MNAILTIITAVVLLAAPARAAPGDPIPMPNGNWWALETTDGVIYRVDPKSIHMFDTDHPMRGMATALVYRDFGRGPFNIENMQTLLFNCDGYFSFWGRPGAWYPIPPRSAVHRIEDVACGIMSIDEARSLK